MGKFERKIAEAPTAYNFGDLQLQVGHATREPKDVSLTTKFSTNIALGLPFVASPMDTVTEDRMAIALARKGGIGVIHRNCEVEQEVDMVSAVKRAESFIIRDAKAISKAQSARDAEELLEKYKISALLVVEAGKLVGIVTKRDVQFSQPDDRVEQIMTKRVITATEDITEAQAVALMREHKVEKLPVVDGEGRSVGLITMHDINLRNTYREAARGRDGRLLVAAAVSPFDLDRAVKLVRAGANAVVIDVAHFDNEGLIAPTKKIIAEVGNDADVIVGNLGTFDGATEVLTRLDGRVQGLRAGIGSGSICKTTESTGAGAPTPFAVSQIADAEESLGLKIPIIADGGIRGAANIAVALALGAQSAMMGNVFAGCDETPSVIIEIGRKRYKAYRGMGSNAAREKRQIVDRYANSGGKGIEEGIVTHVPWSGPVSDVIDELAAGLRVAMGYAGATTVQDMLHVKVQRVISAQKKNTPTTSGESE